jgi:hypothetical protein
MAAITPESPSFPASRNPTYLPHASAQSAADYLAGFPPPNRYLLHRVTDNPFASLACTQLFAYPSIRLPATHTDFIGIDPMNGRYARVLWANRVPVYVDPHWNDLEEIRAFYDAKYATFKKHNDRNEELYRAGGVFMCGAAAALDSLSHAESGVFLIAQNPGFLPSRFTIYYKEGDRIRSVPISVTPSGDWLLWNDRSPSRTFTNFPEIAQLLNLRCPLSQWVRMMQERPVESGRFSLFSTPLFDRQPAAVETIDSRAVGAEREALLPNNPFTQSYDRDFFKGAAADGALPAAPKETN